MTDVGERLRSSDPARMLSYPRRQRKACKRRPFACASCRRIGDLLTGERRRPRHGAANGPQRGGKGNAAMMGLAVECSGSLAQGGGGPPAGGTVIERLFSFWFAPTAVTE
jgi:hypothetical protein